MTDAYDPPHHPDGPTDLDDVPTPLVGTTRLDDDSGRGLPAWDWSKEDPE